MKTDSNTVNLPVVRQLLARLDAIVVQYPYLVMSDCKTDGNTWSANDAKRICGNENGNV